MTPLRIVVTEGTGRERRELCDLLNAQPDLEVVATLADGGEAGGWLAALRPGLALVALAREGLDALRTLAGIKRRFPAVPLVILSDHAEPGYAAWAWAAGASAYVMRQAGPLELLRAIRSAAPAHA